MLEDTLDESLRRLDTRLRRAVTRASATSPGIAGDGFRGLYIDLAEVQTLFAQAPAEPGLWTEPDADTCFSMIRIAELFALDAFDVDSLLIARAPEPDLPPRRNGTTSAARCGRRGATTRMAVGSSGSRRWRRAWRIMRGRWRNGSD
jgi:hypothetical protein